MAFLILANSTCMLGSLEVQESSMSGSPSKEPWIRISDPQSLKTPRRKKGSVHGHIFGELGPGPVCDLNPFNLKRLEEGSK